LSPSSNRLLKKGEETNSSFRGIQNLSDPEETKGPAGIKLDRAPQGEIPVDFLGNDCASSGRGISIPPAFHHEFISLQGASLLYRPACRGRGADRQRESTNTHQVVSP